MPLRVSQNLRYCGWYPSMCISRSSSSLALRSSSRLTSASRPSRPLRRSMTSRYSSQSASKSGSVATSWRTVSSFSENLASNDRMRSTISLVLLLCRTTDCFPVLRAITPSLRTTFDDLGLGLDLTNLIDDFRIGQRRDVAGILVVRNRPEDAAHDFPGTGLWHVGDDHDTARAVNRPYLADHGVFHSFADVLAWGEPGLQRYVEVRDLAFDI